MLLQEREALREALERMQTDLLESEDRALTYRSQLQSMKQLYNHAKRWAFLRTIIWGPIKMY